jgi:hypothetical protein
MVSKTVVPVVVTYSAAMIKQAQKPHVVAQLVPAHYTFHYPIRQALTGTWRNQLFLTNAYDAERSGTRSTANDIALYSSVGCIMTASFGTLRTSIFGISMHETSVARRGFQVDQPGVRLHLEHVGQTFLLGYHAALKTSHPNALAQRLDEVETEFRGFAYEGAAMGLALLDHLTPWHRYRLQAFLDGPGSKHAYMIHVGVGWMWARLCWRIERPMARLDPLLRWLAVDGYGFHQGYFHWQQYIKQQTLPLRLSGYARRAFDQGLGRSLWFVEGAEISRVATTIAAFARARQADLWSGVGLASTYAGGADRAALVALRDSAGVYRADLAQGAAFAAKARQHAGNPTSNAATACEVFCGRSADAAADITVIALEHLPADGAEPMYEIWRQRIRAHFAEEALTV